MKEQGREKPARAEEGQRWRTKFSGRDYTLLNEPGEPGSFRRRYDDGSFGECTWTEDEILRGSTYLGGPSPSPEGAGRVMAEKPNGKPVACLKCGGALTTNRSFVCETCYPTAVIDAYPGEWEPLRDAWNCGARDFPRSPASVPAYAPPPPCKQCGEAICRCKFPPTPPRPPLYGRAVGEMRDQSGTPLTALQAIQSRPKPEPYVCPVDDWDLLPSVDEWKR